VLPAARREPDLVRGEVIGVDRFGNLLTSVTQGDLTGFVEPRRLVVEIAGVRLGAPVSAYDEAPPGGLGVIVGSTGRLEVFAREGSARATLGVGRGEPVLVKRG
jgi:S-adenosylmethionine hydrolase